MNTFHSGIQCESHKLFKFEIQHFYFQLHNLFKFFARTPEFYRGILSRGRNNARFTYGICKYYLRVSCAHYNTLFSFYKLQVRPDFLDLKAFCKRSIQIVIILAIKSEGKCTVIIEAENIYIFKCYLLDRGIRVRAWLRTPGATLTDSGTTSRTAFAMCLRMDLLIFLYNRAIYSPSLEKNHRRVNYTDSSRILKHSCHIRHALTLLIRVKSLFLLHLLLIFQLQEKESGMKAQLLNKEGTMCLRAE